MYNFGSALLAFDGFVMHSLFGSYSIQFDCKRFLGRHLVGLYSPITALTVSFLILG